MSLSFFLEMAWKSSFIAIVALSLATLLKSRSPADRASVLQVGLALLVLLPLVSLFLPAWQVELAAAVADVQPLVGTLLQAQEAAPLLSAEGSMPSPMAAAPAAASGAWDDPALLIAILYAGGLAMSAGRLLGGLVTLRRWTSEAEEVSCPRWTEALERVTDGTGRAPVPLRVSADVPAPLSWGWMKPVILLDPDSYRRGEDADAILAHEMAHIARRDWPALMISRIATALFWFNPLVWLVGRAFIRHAEEAADCRALAQVEPTHYAQALLGCATHVSRAAIPANSIATSDLAKRVHAILEGRSRSIPSGSRLCAATVLGCLALAGPVSAMKLIPAAAAEAAASAASFTASAPKVPAMMQSLIVHAPERPAPVRAAVPAGAAPKAPAVALTAAAVAPPMPVSVAAPVASSSIPALPAPAIAIAPQAPAVPVPAVPAVAIAVQTAPALSAAEREELRRAQVELRQASEEAARAGERAGRIGRRVAELAKKEAARNMAEGAVNMERGAEDMKRGARDMAEEAVKLRNPAYREQQIAREGARGRTVTHQQLIDAIPELEKGSREMIKGAEEMRRGAEQMRRSARD